MISTAGTGIKATEMQDSSEFRERRSKSHGEPTQEIKALRERISALSTAILRISASLDVGTVLQEAVDSARALTSARYGVIATTDEAGEVRDFVTSGFTPEEHRQFAEWPDGPRLFAHLRDLPGPLRLTDLPAYVRARGFSPDLMRSKTLQATPMRHRGEHVGNFFLAEKEGAPEFTAQDEEMLVLFASQAAAAIANAGTYRDEQRARADLEALVETSPVGVVVFDAATGRPVSFNREAKRIVEGLRIPGRSLEQLLEVVTCRRADGREVSLSEMPVAQTLINSETVRAEEITLSVPDGRSVTTLLNVTPIRSAQGAVVSVVITLQDLAPLEELDRLRAEFLGMVSHELRTPLAAIKGSTTTVLGASPALHPAELHQFFRVIDEQADHMRGLISDLLDVGRIDAGMLFVLPEPTEVSGVVDQARSAFLSGGAKHTIVIDLPQDLPWVLGDRQRIVQVLNNLFSNSARHSPESSLIRVAAVHDGVHVSLSVSDEGRGIAAEQLPYVFRKYKDLGGDGERGLRGSGLGLAICKGLVEAHGGRIWATSSGPGQGTQVTFTIPVAEEPKAAAGSGPSGSPSPGKRREPIPILVVDDDPQMLRYVREALTKEGYSPIVTGEGQDLSRIIRTEKPRLVLLDLLLPGTDGIELMETLPELADMPVIFISAYGKDETVARALEAGAADYIVKPFSPTELMARIRAALRTRAGTDTFVLGDLAIYYEQRRVTVGGRPVQLTVTEYELLRILSVNAGRVLTYDSLVRRMWSGPDYGDPDRVRTFVKQLRRKLADDPARPRYVLNERGVGYRMPGP